MSSKLSDHNAPVEPAGLHFTCKHCGNPLTEPGAVELTGTITLSPPDENGKVSVTGILDKHHVGRDCAESYSQRHRQEARTIAAKLITHTTSVENVDLIAKALWEAEQRGQA